MNCEGSSSSNINPNSQLIASISTVSTMNPHNPSSSSSSTNPNNPPFNSSSLHTATFSNPNLAPSCPNRTPTQSEMFNNKTTKPNQPKTLNPIPLSVRKNPKKCWKERSGGEEKNPKKPKTLNVSPQPCIVCGKQFASAKALHGHMRCHPDRNWRGMNPPTGQIRPVKQPNMEFQTRPVKKPDMEFQTRPVNKPYKESVLEEMSKLTENEILMVVARSIILLSKDLANRVQKENRDELLSEGRKRSEKKTINGGEKKEIVGSDVRAAVKKEEEGGGSSSSLKP